jgi:hypothetical protein
MKFLLSFFRNFLPKDIQKPLGRWKIEYRNSQMNSKVDLSNEDHCGPCGQYALKQKKKQIRGAQIKNGNLIKKT